MLDAVLGNFGERSLDPRKHTPEPVGSCTIVHWTGTGFGSDVSDAEGRVRLQIGQLIAFSALAQRQYGSHFRYLNSDAATMVGQHFDVSKPSGVAIQTRRRDGRTVRNFGSSTTIPKFTRPMHVEADARLDLDDSLLEALLRVSDQALASRVVDAVVLFNQANTDGDAITEQVELVLLRAAFETLLQATHRSIDLKGRISAHFQSDFEASQWAHGRYDESTWRARWPKAIRRPSDAWVEDFCNARNTAAHGRGSAATHAPSVWSDRNHLMLGSWIFPLIVKGILADAGFYQLSDLDKDFRRGWELFLAHDISDFQSSTSTLKWCDVEELFLDAQFERELIQMGIA